MKYWLILVFSVTFTACLDTDIDLSDPYEIAGDQAVSSRATSILHSTSSVPLKARYYYPQDLNALPPRPLVLMLPGFSVSFEDYAYYSRHLASHGYIVLGLDYEETSSDMTIANHDDKAQQIIDAIDEVLRDENLAGRIDANKIALMGHSLGGKLAFYSASLDDRIGLVIALDPSNAGGPPCFISNRCHNYPVAFNPSTNSGERLSAVVADSLIMRSEPDITNPEAAHNARYFFYGRDGLGTDAVPAKAYYYDLGSASHASYSPILASTTRAMVKRYSIAMLKDTFDDIESIDYLIGSRLDRDKRAGRIKAHATRFQ